MASSSSSSRHSLSKYKVFLGFEDEEITNHHHSYLCHTTNKVGGKPDWGDHEQFSNPKCLLCGLTLPLITQIYAPLEVSRFHRTLYLFGCINPSCWNKKESWVCLRRQLLDRSFSESETHVKIISNFDWCEGADDWVDFETDPSSENPYDTQDLILQSSQFINKMAELDVNERSVENIDSNKVTNQNIISSMATAVLDNEQMDPVIAESLISSQVDVASIYQQVKPVPKVPSDSFQFLSFFISVIEESEEKTSDIANYEFNMKGVIVNEEPNMINKLNTATAQVNNDESKEKYEKTLPAHGDKLFHNLISRIQRTPGQLLRYIRDSGTPLFLYPAEDVPQHCQHCNGDLVYELQLLPTLISRLQLQNSGTGHIEYGTVFILACKQSCWNSQDHFRTEHVLIQREL